MFADRIECGSFGKIFRNAREILNGGKAIPDRHGSGMPVLLPRIPEAEKRLFFAASMEDVFAPWVPGMTIRLAALYAVNESGGSKGKSDKTRVKYFDSCLYKSAGQKGKK